MTILFITEQYASLDVSSIFSALVPFVAVIMSTISYSAGIGMGLEDGKLQKKNNDYTSNCSMQKDYTTRLQSKFYTGTGYYRVSELYIGYVLTPHITAYAKNLTH